MIQKDLSAYAIANWSSFLAPVTELSKGDQDQVPLVEDSAQLYSFDDICSALFAGKNVPTSADGIEITNKSVRFVEFKSGFRKKISRNSWDEEKARCKAIQSICNEYWDLFFEKQEKETKELIRSIRFKALESYLTLEKQFLPHCPDASEPIPVTFTAVIDGDAVENMIDTLAEVSGKRLTKNTSIAKVRKALKRLAGIQDANGNVYCYDRIEVLSAQDYKSQLQQRS